MNFFQLLIFLLLQMVVNGILRNFIPVDNLFGILAFYLSSSFIIAFIGAFLSTPSGYKKDFLKQPGFHKMMLLYFVVFFAMDLLFLFF